MRNRLALTAVLTLAITATATAAAGTADKKITPKGAGKVKLGATAAQLRADGLIGRLKPGCPLEGPGTRSARLKAPLKGFVDFTRRSPRKVRHIHIRGGAAARGVRVGDTLADITAAFPKRRIIRATEAIFGFTRVKIPKRGGGRMDFAVRVKTGKITSIDVPRIRICD